MRCRLEFTGLRVSCRYKLMATEVKTVKTSIKDRSNYCVNTLNVVEYGLFKRVAETMFNHHDFEQMMIFVNYIQQRVRTHENKPLF